MTPELREIRRFRIGRRRSAARGKIETTEFLCRQRANEAPGILRSRSVPMLHPVRRICTTAPNAA